MTSSGPGPADLRRAFDAAADFTALGRYLWDPIGVATARAAAPCRGERVLDACCGTGASALPAARATGPEGTVDAVDLSGPMIDELRRRASELPQLHAHRADVTTWTDGGYDAVLCALGIFFLPDMTAGTDHLVRAARPGGRVVLTIWRGAAMAAAGHHLGRAVAAATDTPPPAPRPPHLFDRINHRDGFADWLGGRGLSGVEVTEHDLRLPATPEIAWLVVLGSGYRAALAGLPDDVVDDVRERYLASLHAEGTTELDASTLIGTGHRPG